MKFARFLMGVAMLVALGAQPTLAADEVTPEVILSDIQNADQTAALAKLKTWDKDSPLFAWSLLQAGRVLYRASRWSEFFGIAHYGRRGLPFGLETEKLRLLEVLAFIRHCQLDQARAVFSERPADPAMPIYRHYLALSELLQVPLEKTGKPRYQDNSKVPVGLFAQSRLWPVGSLDIRKLDPYKIRRKVVPVCKKTSVKEGSP